MQSPLSRLNSGLLKDLRIRCSGVFLWVAGLASVTLSTGLIGQLLVESQREIWSHAVEISSMVSTVMSLDNSSSEQLDGLLNRYKIEHNGAFRDGVNYILVVDKDGRVVLSSRSAWDRLLLNDSLFSRTESSDRQFLEIRQCFVGIYGKSSARGSSACLKIYYGLYFPLAESYTAALPIRPSIGDRGMVADGYLVVVNFDPSIASGDFWWQLLLIVAVSFLFVLTFMGLLAALLYRSILPAVRAFAEVDDLTGLVNRRACMDLGIRLLAQAENDCLPYILGILDLDNFKAINDTYGHQCGDFVLREVSVALAESLHGTDLLARLGGEEFMVMAQCSSAHALLVMERLRNQVELLSPRWEGRALKVTVSIGLTSTEQLGYNLNYLYAAADAALYRAKDQGRNRICWSSSGQSNVMYDPWSPGIAWKSSFGSMQTLDLPPTD